MIDINCDLGEGMSAEGAMMPFITSANVACGGHIGDKESILETLQLANKHNVKCGAHPSYPDRVGFGRKRMEIEPEELRASLKDQLSSFLGCADELGIDCHHVKLHGALYNDTAADSELAKLVIEVLEELSLKVPLYAPWQSELSKVALQNGFEVYHEAFADRNYEEDLSLVPRTKPNSLISIGDVSEHVQRIVVEGVVRSLSGVEVPIAADTICIHGDGEYALEVAKIVKQVVG